MQPEEWLVRVTDGGATSRFPLLYTFSACHVFLLPSSARVTPAILLPASPSPSPFSSRLCRRDRAASQAWQARSAENAPCTETQAILHRKRAASSEALMRRRPDEVLVRSTFTPIPLLARGIVMQAPAPAFCTARRKEAQPRHGSRPLPSPQNQLC